MPRSIRLERLAYRAAYRILRVLRPLAVWRTGGGVKCVILAGDTPRRVLLVRHTYGLRAWDLPGGGHAHGEAPPDTARREMREELGLDVDDWRPSGTIDGRVDRHRQTVHIFVTRFDEPPGVTLQLAELSTFGWFELDRLPLDLGRFVAPILGATGLT